MISSFESFALSFTTISVTFLVGLVLYYKWCFSYWKKIGLEYLEPSIPFGNTLDFVIAKKNIGEQFAKFYEQFKIRKVRHGGVYMLTKPFYIPIDPEIVKDIMVKNFNHFVDRGFHVDEEADPLTGNLFGLEGEKWKNLRQKLTATFTSGKMKMMFNTMAKCAEELDVLFKVASSTKEDVDVKDMLSRFTIDVISSCAFGLESNSLKNPNSKIFYFGKKIGQNTVTDNLKIVLQFILPKKFLKLIKFKSTKADVEEFIINMVKQTANYREKNNIHRKDLMHLLLQLKNRGKLYDDERVTNEDGESKEVALTINELAAQAFVFLVAGFDTSATTLAWTLYELSQNQNLQNKLRNEITEVLKKHNNQMTYEAIMDMTYMDQVINETLRKYPALPFLNRQCTIPYKVPNSNVKLEKGTLVLIPILGLQKDPEYYPNPEMYDPERFNESNRKNNQAFTWLPFGEGPRICIGMRFGLMQTKIGLTTLLKHYKTTLSPTTKVPMPVHPKMTLTTSLEPIHLNISKISI